MKVTAAITHEKGKLAIEDCELAAPTPGQVLVRIVAAGICHTDTAGIEQLIPVALPAIFGHEGVGVVEEVGDGVATLKKGDKVILSFPSCGICSYCIEGRPFMCDDIGKLFFGGVYNDGTKRFSQNGVEVSSFFAQGSFATHTVVDARNAVKADVKTEDDLAKLCSLGCGVQTGAGTVLNRIQPKPGSSLVVFGCGGVGMAAIMAAKIAGCSQIFAVDAVDSRLKLAKELGATHAINAKTSDSVEEIVKATGGGADYSVECTGIAAVTSQALDCLRRGGLGVVVSVTGPQTVEIGLEPQLMNKSATLAGLTEGGSNPQVFIPQLVKFYNEGRLPVDKLVEFYDFKDIEKGFEDSHSGATIKPILRF